MNPTTAQGLDPQLKETYDRVMGTQVNPPASSMSVEPFSPPPVQPVAATPPVQAQPVEPVTAAHTDEHIFVATPAPSTQNFVAEKPHKISPVIFIAVGIVLFAVYTVVWLKVFGIF